MIDVRSENEFAEDCLPNSINYPFSITKNEQKLKRFISKILSLKSAKDDWRLIIRN
ncbi:rhodanese-like domain-containing protein [Hydrococcus rivularis]|uniref:rhodanese-like domain-containing protein n=1 Tax=Hydrococcus rivularis TaxID=1616834 RepID=UPI001114F93B